MNAGDGRRIAALDEMRGVAVSLVLLFHATYFGNLPAMIGGDPAHRSWIVAFMSGWTGVDLFFVLSGFLITSILLQARGEPHYYRSFYVRRVLRIAPAYYAALVLAYVVVSGPLAMRRASPESFVYLATYLSNVKIAISGWESIPLAMQHFWSLAIEEHFYLLWPWVVARIDPQRGARLCALRPAAPVQAAEGFGERVALWYTAVFALSFGLALASYYVIERPFLRMKDRWAPTRAAVPAR